MTTITATNAKLKVRLDLAAASAELKALEEQWKRLQEGLKAEAGQARDQQRQADRQASKADEQAQAGGGGGRFRFNPLDPLDTALSAIGAIPLPGTTSLEKAARVALSMAEGGVPLVEGFGRAALKSMGQDDLARLMSIALAKIQENSDKISELKAKNDAIAPAYEAMKTMVKAQMLAGGTPSGKDLGDMGAAMYKVIAGRMELERKVKRLGLEAIGEGAERLFEGLFQ